MQLWWGSDLTLLYNDASIAVVGHDHPGVLARSGRRAWGGTQQFVVGLVQKVRESGVAETRDNVAAIPIFADDGSVDGVFCTIIGEDISARRLEVLRKLNERIGARALIDALASDAEDVPCAVLYLHEGGQAKAAAWARMKPDDSGFPAIVNDDRFSRLSAITEIPMRVGPITNGVAIPIRDAKNELAGVLVCGTDPHQPFDAAYRTFFELVASQLRNLLGLSELDRAKTGFLSNMSHQLRTPLTLLLGPIEELLRRTEEPSVRDQLEMAHRNAVRLQRLVDDLLDFSQIEAGRADLEFEPTQLATLTSDVANAFRTTLEHAGIDLTIDCDPVSDQVYVDPQAWEKIVLNLVSNAFKFTFRGSVAVSLRRSGDNVCLTVRDTGVGIPGEQLSRIFERFHRVESQRSRSYEGSGIGLSLVHDLVHMHGGTIEVTSTPEVDTTFTVTLPLGHAHLPAAQTKHLATSHDIRSASGSFVSEADSWQLGRALDGGAEPDVKPRVLIADANVDVREYVARALEHDCIVDVAADGTTALDLARRQPPDLVLADTTMPGLDGIALLRELRSDLQLQEVPVIMLSGPIGDAGRHDGLRAGANDYLTKPFSPRELRARVRTQLELASTRAQMGTARAEIRAKDDFLSLFGHELRNPLSTVFTTVQVLMRQQPSKEVMIMERAVRNLTRLVDDLLDMSRLTRGKIVLHRSHVQISDLVDRALQRVASLAEERKVRVLQSVARTGLQVDCDPERVVQILHNVISNAMKFSEPGSMVTVEASRIDTNARVVVRDEGAGIDPARLPHVFEPFQERTNTPGLGLGLAIAHHLVELHGGRIAVQSAGIGRGTECVIVLPLESGEIAAAAPAPVATEARKRKRVLLVEDNHDTAVALQGALESLGYQVALAHNGPVALTVARSFQPDVALLDIGLPVMDGWELSRRLRELHVPSRELHIVAVTARDQDEDKQRSREAGFVEHLVKPIDLNRLERVVESLPGGTPDPAPPR